ncbi:hypothetical protein TWF694_006105 [Orbilia ellipsospora]|uniref:Uncharacterized protein n=1 Tax=Orbilia ellipsospora TaxID=2528407 RepID=A0AAV9WSW4_9PEZI
MHDLDARFIRFTQEWKEPELIGPDVNYESSENLPTGLIGSETIYDTSPEWMHDGCIDLGRSQSPWLLTELIYSPAKVNRIPMYLPFEDLEMGEENIHAPWLTDFENPPYGEEPEDYQEVYSLSHQSLLEDEEHLLEKPPRLPGGGLSSQYSTASRRAWQDEEKDSVLDKDDFQMAISGYRGSEYIGSLANAIDMEAEADENIGSTFKFEPGTLNFFDDEMGTGDGKNLQDVRDQIGMYGFWGPVSIKFVSDYSRWHTTQLVKEEA